MRWDNCEASDARWNKLYSYLLEYGRVEGHYNIPKRYEITLENGTIVKVL